MTAARVSLRVALAPCSKVSPDAFIQMALQLAYFRDQGRFDLTYTLPTGFSSAFCGPESSCAPIGKLLTGIGVSLQLELDRVRLEGGVRRQQDRTPARRRSTRIRKRSGAVGRPHRRVACCRDFRRRSARPAMRWL